MRRLGFVLMLALPFVVHAQYTLPGFSGAVRIALTPSQPTPNSTVTASLESGLIDTDTATIAWYVDGRRLPTTDARIPVTLGNLGTRTSVSATVTTAEGSIVSADTTIIPTTIDLLYESDSYTPPFYNGRALPSAGSHLIVQAFAHFVDGATEVKPADIVYSWKRNGQVLLAASGRGKSTLVTDAPYLYGTDTITLSAASVDGAFTGERTIRIPSVEPVIRLYQDHPLFGLRLDQALATSTDIVEREMTFAAIPFFATIASPADPTLSYDWRVNGSRVDTGTNVPYELTLGAEQGGGARLSLALSQSTNIFFGSDTSWTIRFGASAPADDIFAPRN